MLQLRTVTSTFTYQGFTFDVGWLPGGSVEVRAVRTPRGLLATSTEGFPLSVLTAMDQAAFRVSQWLSSQRVHQGTITFSGETEKVVNLPNALLNSNLYTVMATPPEAIPYGVSEQTPTSFVLTLGTSVGTPETPVDIPFDVFVSPARVSPLRDTVVVPEAGSVTVTFDTPLSDAGYRVYLMPVEAGVFYISSQTRRGFVIQAGYSFAPGETQTISYDVVL